MATLPPHSTINLPNFQWPFHISFRDYPPDAHHSSPCSHCSPFVPTFPAFQNDSDEQLDNNWQGWPTESDLGPPIVQYNNNTQRNHQITQCPYGSRHDLNIPTLWTDLEFESCSPAAGLASSLIETRSSRSHPRGLFSFSSDLPNYHFGSPPAINGPLLSSTSRSPTLFDAFSFPALRELASQTCCSEVVSGLGIPLVQTPACLGLQSTVPVPFSTHEPQSLSLLPFPDHFTFPTRSPPTAHHPHIPSSPVLTDNPPKSLPGPPTTTTNPAPTPRSSASPITTGKPKRLHCEFPACRYACNSRKDLDDHSNSKHFGQRRYGCSTCEKRYTTRSNCRRHIKASCPGSWIVRVQQTPDSQPHG